MTQHTCASAATRLILVYNADSGLLTALMHAVHKQVSPSTYPCSLCALTYGLVSMRGAWKRFLNSFDLDLVFHHRDDFTQAFPALGTAGPREVALPAILLADPGDEPRVIIPAEALDQMHDLAELMEHLEAQLLAEQLARPMPDHSRAAA
ncbi:MAG: hypothetical protein AAF494_07845 [Pseudomonadota bacterium]